MYNRPLDDFVSKYYEHGTWCDCSVGQYVGEFRKKAVKRKRELVMAY
jgi:hypothetical protein